MMSEDILQGIRIGLDAAVEQTMLDVDWAQFSKTGIPQWANGVDSVRDYRLGLAAAQGVAAAIRHLDPVAILLRHRARIDQTPPARRDDGDCDG